MKTKNLYQSNASGQGMVCEKSTKRPLIISIKCEKMFRHFTALFILLFTLSVGSAWGRTTVTTSISTVVSDSSFTVSSGNTVNSICLSLNLDANINVSINSGGNNGSFWGTAPSIDWRVYQGQSGTITLSAANGCTLDSVTFTYGNSNSGIINTSGNGQSIGSQYRITSGTRTKISGTSVTYYVGSTAAKTNGQVRITAISVTYSTPAGCSVAPSVGSSLSSVSATVNSITATVPISGIGGCDITENGLVYSTSVATPEVGAANCTKVTTTACGSTAANKTVEITGLACGQSYYVRGYATNNAGTSYTSVTTQSTSSCPTDNFIDMLQETSGYTSASPHTETGTYSTPTLTDKTTATTGTCKQTHYHFVGWITAAKYTAGSTITDSDIQTPTSATGATYYAVWAAQGSGGGGGFDNTADGTFKIYANVSGTNYYATGTGSKITASTDISEAADYVFTKISNGVYSIMTGDDYITYSSSTNLGTSSSSYSWTVTTGTKGSWRLTSETSGRGFIYRSGTGFGGYSTSNVTAAGTEYYDVEIGGGTSYEDYLAKCCEELGTINGSISLSHI